MIATVPFIEDTFRSFNALCFEGSLPEVPVVLSRAGTFLGKLEFKLKRGLFGMVVSRYGYRMKISTSFDLPQNELEDVVIHEMIHYYIALNNLHDSSTHGETFRSIMTNINSKYGRNVTVRHRGAVPQVVNKQKECQRFFCISTFRDGKIGITVTAAAKVLELHRRIPEFYDIARMEWFSSNDPFFSRFPRSRTPKIYRINREELYKHLSDALPLR